MFLGTHFPRLDEKGRLFLPARYRDDLADGVVITKGHERSLSLYPIAEFERFTEQLREAPVTDKRVRDYMRQILGGAFDQRPDKQGRITIPPALRDYARLRKDCVVIGQSNGWRSGTPPRGRRTRPSRNPASPSSRWRCCPGFSSW